MNARRSLGEPALVLCAALAAGCGRSSSAPPPARATSPPPAALTTSPSNALQHLPHALPRLQTIKLWLGTNELAAELALTRPQIATGMMFRDLLGEQEGMLFVFGGPSRVGFYMKNVKVPLSVAYIDADGVILEIHDLHPFNETPVSAGTDQVQYVLEVNQGWFKRHNVGVSAVIHTERGTLRKTFFGPR